MHSSIGFSIILPCYNPIEGWHEIIEKNIETNFASLENFELIIVNDGSFRNFRKEETKKTFSKYPFVKILSYNENKGKGGALRHGVNAAKGEFIIYTDIDFPYTSESFLKIYAALKNEKADVAVGIRGEEYYTHLSRTRVRISKLLRWFIKKFLRIPTDDTQCGLKGFNQRGKEVFLKTTINRYLFDLEFIFLAAKNKLRITTVEVELRSDVQLSIMNSKILLQEFGNFLKIFVKSIINN